MSQELPDIQNTLPQYPRDIDRVGIKDLPLYISIPSLDGANLQVMAKSTIGVSLHSIQRGIHMSRFLKVLKGVNYPITYASMRGLLKQIIYEQNSKNGYVSFIFPYLMKRTAPISKETFSAIYNTSIFGSYIDGNYSYVIEVEVPVMSVCPCSKSISVMGAHCQRAMIQIMVWLSDDIYIEDVIGMCNKSGSCDLYPYLKREDEKYITEEAFNNPKFVEDIIRSLAVACDKNNKIVKYKIDITSFESIHAHNAYASLCVSSRSVPA